MLPLSKSYFSAERGWTLLAFVLCLGLGLGSILNVHPIGDGLWFWYAVAIRGGEKLYRDMHLPLQPLFVLMTAWTQALAGKGWLASKLLALAQLLVFCAGLSLVTGRLLWSGWQRGLLICAVFGLQMGAFYSRFDDYHVTVYCLEVFAVYFLLSIDKRNSSWVSVVTGILSGLAMGTRLNDGAALVCGCGLAVLFLVPEKKIRALFYFVCSAGLALLGVIALTGDSVHDWALYSIVRAAAIKGGTSHVMYAPLLFPRELISVVHHAHVPRRDLLVIGFVAFYCALLEKLWRGPRRTLSRSMAVAGCLMLLALAISAWHGMVLGEPLYAIAAFGVLAIYGLSLWEASRIARVCLFSRPENWTPRELLLAIPLLQVMSGSMTSGRSILEAYEPVALFLLILPFSLPPRWWGAPQRTAFAAVCAITATSAFLNKTVHPYAWNHFQDGPMFVNRQWYDHPIYGPMYIERDQLQITQEMCNEIGVDGPPKELLSITNPYLNYFCDVSPWHGYIQTWYDTTSAQTIDRLIAELDSAPPTWIIYQRALDTMAAHEAAFNGGKPIPHRALDQLIATKIALGQWSVVGRRTFQGADWIVIRTTKPRDDSAR